MPAIQPLTLGPQRRPARLAMPITAGVAISLKASIASAVMRIGRVGPTYARWRATRRSPSFGSSSGSSKRQRSTAIGQRVWIRHPLGGLAGLGTSPWQGRIAGEDRRGLKAFDDQPDAQ